MDNSTTSTQELERLQRRIPTVSDKAIVDLVNGIHVSKDVVRYRQNRHFLSKIFDWIDGSDAQRRLLLDGNLIAGQEALYGWVLELTHSLNISQVALEVTQQSLLEARSAIRQQQHILQQSDRAMEVLRQNLDRLAQQVGERIDRLETRIRQLEVRVAANEDLDRIISAWSAKHAPRLSG